MLFIQINERKKKIHLPYCFFGINISNLNCGLDRFQRGLTEDFGVGGLHDTSVRCSFQGGFTGRVKSLKAYNAFKTVFHAQPVENLSCMGSVGVGEDLKSKQKKKKKLRKVLILPREKLEPLLSWSLAYDFALWQR